MDGMEPNGPGEPRRDLKLLVPGAIVLAGLIIAGAIIWTSGFRGSSKTATLTPTPAGQPTGAASGNIADDDPFLGNPDAPVIFVEFSDFQCPFCRRLFRETLPQLKEEFIKTGKVKFVYRDYPLSAIHGLAETYAQAGECADDQEKFWPMHDKIFEEQDRAGSGTITNFSAADVKRWAREVGLDGVSFDACLDSGKHAGEVAKDFSDGQALGVSGTPTVFVNGRSVVGALAYAQFKALIEAALAAQ